MKSIYKFIIFNFLFMIILFGFFTYNHEKVHAKNCEYMGGDPTVVYFSKTPHTICEWPEEIKENTEMYTSLVFINNILDISIENIGYQICPFLVTISILLFNIIMIFSMKERRIKYNENNKNR